MGKSHGSPFTIREIYDKLYEFYGPQNWWPADTAFEVMMGAILTQNTAWENVVKAMENLRPYLDPQTLGEMDPEKLKVLIRPSGFYNIKAKRIKHFLAWFGEKGYSIQALKAMDGNVLREELLAIHGIGPETADSILLYALEKPFFVIDAYTKRLFHRLGFSLPKDYDEIQRVFEANLEREVALYNEYHGLIVQHSKEVCRKKPLCTKCFLVSECPLGMSSGINGS
ncbi:MAG: endonuclease III domain-containing protein [Clostridia bacterium]|jgi:endonuclease-3 related protein